MNEHDALVEALFKLYSDAGTEVTYVTDDGRTLAYWPKRYLQALRRAVEEDSVLGFVEGLVMREPSRGFGYLHDANRLDLTVEAVVVEKFPELFPSDVVEAAKERLLDYEYQPKPSPSEAQNSLSSLEPGSKVLIELNVAPDGKIEARLA